MTLKRNYLESKNALVLTGGGARAAYQIGVLSAMTKFIPRNHGIPFPILAGTSAGAINSTALACYASCFHLGVKKLEWAWKNFNISSIYHSDPYNVFTHIGKGMLASFQADYANKQPQSLLNNAPLRELLTDIVDFKRIDKNIMRGYISSVSVTASSYSSGDSISFYQSDGNIPNWFRARRRGEMSQLNTQHLMASAAIPMIFPSAEIKNQHFGDGSIHQLSPLSPAIHLGAKKIFVIGVEQPKQDSSPTSVNQPPPTSGTIAGHLLDSIFADTMHSDLERMTRINETLKLISLENRNANEGLKHIDSFVINPSQDINVIATKYYYDLPLSIRLLFRATGIGSRSESSLISYLLFDKNFCSELIRLGFNDAMQKEQTIRRFLNL